jgi:LPXTG-motif cell wall-anchored protein
MQAEYAAWAKANGVSAHARWLQPREAGPDQQLHQLLDFPPIENTALAVLAGLIGLIVAGVVIRRRRRAA